MGGYLNSIALQLGIPLWTLIVLAVWSLAWKIPALWISARKKQLVWFIVLILVNTAGILEILYIFIFSKMKPGNKKQKIKKPVKRKIKKKGR